MGFSAFTFADTYPSSLGWHVNGYAYSSTAQGACDIRAMGTYAIQKPAPSTDWGCWNYPYTNYPSVIMSGLLHDNYCPYGGSLSGTSCINASSCTGTDVRDPVTGECKPQARVCSSTEYDNGTACAPIPDCNADHPDGRYFFDMTTKACATTNTVGTICISATQKYCPPIDDCKNPGYICTNQPSAVEAAQAIRQAEIDAAKAAADAKKAEIAAIAAAAADAALAKQRSADDAKAAKDAAAAALAAAKTSGVQSAIDKAIQDYSKFAADYIDSLSRATNSSSAKTKAFDIDGQAGTEAAAIPASVPGNADAHKKNVDGLYPGAVTALNDAVTGTGNGTGNGTGVSTKDSPSIDTSKLNKEETQKSIDSNMKKAADALGQPSAGESDTTLPDVDKGVRDAIQGVIDDVNGVDTGLGTNPAAQLGLTNSMWNYAQGTCFPHTFDMGRFGAVSLDRFCAIYDEHIRPLLVMALGVMGVLHVFSYWSTIIAMTI
jgi:hypothetical protein